MQDDKTYLNELAKFFVTDRKALDIQELKSWNSLLIPLKEEGIITEDERVGIIRAFLGLKT